MHDWVAQRFRWQLFAGLSRWYFSPFSFHLPAIVRIPPFHLILAFHLSNLPDMIWFVSSLRLEYTCSRCFFTYEPDRTFQCLKIRRSILLSYTKAGFWGSEILWNIRSGRIMTSRLTTGQRQQVFFYLLCVPQVALNRGTAMPQRDWLFGAARSSSQLKVHT